ncbi:hypothetical protein COU80_02040 [Candidatus Peregrinibacteria bacterium CG10_big_fil_rev_8_21_14_0_10_55_24]|nr:MAG: hypothetical protein COU80_02040 [Candidatus Peregrinibacteria bacterium CG10_big_fil_rev_8_21_14_0_10_55_24]
MMTASSTWQDSKVEIKDLHLDLQNPRVPKHVKDHNDINQIRNYLLEKEDVISIAESIVRSGYHKSATTIVCKEGNKFIVLDGNRRLAACEFLLKPELSPNARDKKRFEELQKLLDMDEIKEIKIAVAPTRKAAEKEIWDIHVKPLLKPWQVLQKLRMYRNLVDSGVDMQSAAKEYGVLKSDFKNDLAKLFFYERILEETPDAKGQDELLGSGFNKIDRAILSSNGKKLLGYEIDDNGRVNPTDQNSFNAKLKKLVPFIVEPGHIEAQASQEKLKETIFFKIDPKAFPLKSASKTKSAPLQKNTKKSAKVPKGSLVKPDWITHEEYLQYIGSDRVKKMLQEMKSLDPTDHENILIVSLRVLLELSLYHQLEGKGHIQKMIKDYKASISAKNANNAKSGKPLLQTKQNWSPSFREMLDFITDASNNIIADPHALTALQKVIKGDTNFVEDLNTFIHNARYMPKKGDSEKTWSHFGRLLFEITSKIS